MLMDTYSSKKYERVISYDEFFEVGKWIKTGNENQMQNSIPWMDNEFYYPKTTMGEAHKKNGGYQNYEDRVEDCSVRTKWKMSIEVEVDGGDKAGSTKVKGIQG